MTDRFDNFFNDLQKWLTKTLARFIAGAFLLFFLGQLYATYTFNNPLLFWLPLLLAVLAYYSRDIMVLILVVIALLVVL